MKEQETKQVPPKEQQKLEEQIQGMSIFQQMLLSETQQIRILLQKAKGGEDLSKEDEDDEEDFEDEGD